MSSIVLLRLRYFSGNIRIFITSQISSFREIYYYSSFILGNEFSHFFDIAIFYIYALIINQLMNYSMDFYKISGYIYKCMKPAYGKLIKDKKVCLERYKPLNHGTFFFSVPLNKFLLVFIILLCPSVQNSKHLIIPVLERLHVLLKDESVPWVSNRKLQWTTRNLIKKVLDTRYKCILYYLA